MKNYIVILLLILGCAAFFGLNLSELGLLKGDENYYFSSARRMIGEGDWITPRYHHHIRFEKPVLYYWIVALFFKLFGVSWAAARATSAFFACLTVILTYFFALLLFGSRKTAAYAAIILATSYLFFEYARIAVTDMVFLFFVTLTLFLFVKGTVGGKKIYLALSAVPLGLSTLVKAPIGIPIVCIAAAAYIIASKKYRVLKDMNLPLWLLLLALIALPWPYLMFKLHGGGYIKHTWHVELLDKAAGFIFNLDNIKNIPAFLARYLGYYIPVLLFAFAPWGLFLPFGLFNKNNSAGEGRVFALSWFWAVFLFFTIVSFKHTHYMLLLSPPLAMIMADLFTDKKIRFLSQKVFAAAAVMAFVSYISFAAFVVPALDDDALKAFSLKLSSEIKEDEAVGIASKEFNLKKLGMYLNNLVSTPYEPSGDDLAQYKRLKKEEIVSFLQLKRRVYCLVTKKDYEAYVPPELQRGLYILEKSLAWKSFKFKKSFPLLLKMDFSLLKEEAYLVSNRRR